MIVDHQSHWLPRVSFDRLLGRRSAPRAERFGDGYMLESLPGVRIPFLPQFIDLDVQLEDMAANGIDKVLVSAACFPGIGEVCGLELEDAVETARVTNQAMADGQRKLAGRFDGLAVVPLQDTDAALRVLDEAILTLGLAGVSMPPNINGMPIVSSVTAPVFKRIAELGVPIVLHPTLRTAMGAAYGRYEEGGEDARWGYAIETRVNWMFDTSAAALALVYSGTLDKNPGLVVLHPHVGGVLPYINRRIARHDSGEPPGVNENRAMNAHPSSCYFRNSFFIDSVTQYPLALPLAIDVYGIDRLLFASDYPFNPRARGLKIIRENLSPEQAQQVLEVNALPRRRAATGIAAVAPSD